MRRSSQGPRLLNAASSWRESEVKSLPVGAAEKFCGHAWAQAYVGADEQGKGGKWVGLDAAFKGNGRGGYDAGHIALAVGNGDPGDFFNMATSLGQFKIEKIGVQKAK